ncbi:glutathione synthase [Kribbella sandramycini]|uniref:Glutathione synthetase n=1 Tax=Kribbella sandramycini TaxID=60450 RepID=A0A7Y4P2I4_9ACTN|nr:glutathione synthase [Kribbella sandramycini]MBB6567093.1 glutathione synthase [Kribbella sandramycini]NOL44811.1 glutathione synthase [Kribbella sandramycini]
MNGVLFVTDPLGGLAADIDATIGMMDATQRLGHAVWCCGPEDLAVVDGLLVARAHHIRLRPRHPGVDHRWIVDPTWFDELTTDVVPVSEFAVVHLRIDPPVDERYLHTTYLLDLAGTRVINRADGVRAIHEKLIALRFPDLCPPTSVGTSVTDLRDFVAQAGTAIVKPVDGFAGLDVWLVPDDHAATSLLESATRGGRRQVIAQQYLPAVAHGNKRLFLLDGEIVGAVLRRPAAADFRIGPPVAVAPIDAADLAIAAALRPVLVQHGLAIAGADVIGGRLIEVNVTCPGGMHKTDALLGTNLSETIVRRLTREGVLT